MKYIFAPHLLCMQNFHFDLSYLDVKSHTHNQPAGYCRITHICNGLEIFTHSHSLYTRLIVWSTTPRLGRSQHPKLQESFGSETESVSSPFQPLPTNASLSLFCGSAISYDRFDSRMNTRVLWIGRVVTLSTSSCIGVAARLYTYSQAESQVSQSLVPKNFTPILQFGDLSDHREPC